MRIILMNLKNLKSHERVSPKHVRKLAREIKTDRSLHIPILVARGCHVVLDGHHRVAALRLLGCRKIPAMVVNYESEAVQVFPRRKSIPVNKRLVEHHARANNLFPYKTTRHICVEYPIPSPVSLYALR